ncbi:hypothetical protein EJ04DRAFT_556701 [Polyplosphaeria fusca]|uniref:Uncharacterized protein n=1 Tax=Polyplosphaeria fusca TaxID=682080 RepID=A0A9P4QLI3_9PLEO|nr:hypothetical protein EJ04DRAFT_556701 [Polyplosphaeria fusca]
MLPIGRCPVSERPPSQMSVHSNLHRTRPLRSSLQLPVNALGHDLELDTPKQVQPFASPPNSAVSRRAVAPVTCTEYPYRNSRICVPNHLLKYADSLVQCQMSVIEKDSIFAVDQATEVHYLGWLGCPKLVCVQVVLPQIDEKNSEWINNPICLVRDDTDRFVGGAVLLPIDAVLTLAHPPPSKIVDLSDHEASYEALLQELDEVLQQRPSKTPILRPKHLEPQDAAITPKAKSIRDIQRTDRPAMLEESELSDCICPPESVDMTRDMWHNLLGSAKMALKELSMDPGNLRPTAPRDTETPYRYDSLASWAIFKAYDLLEEYSHECVRLRLKKTREKRHTTSDEDWLGDIALWRASRYIHNRKNERSRECSSDAVPEQ